MEWEEMSDTLREMLGDSELLDELERALNKDVLVDMYEFIATNHEIEL